MGSDAAILVKSLKPLAAYLITSVLIDFSRFATVPTMNRQLYVECAMLLLEPYRDNQPP